MQFTVNQPKQQQANTSKTSNKPNHSKNTKLNKNTNNHPTTIDHPNSKNSTIINPKQQLTKIINIQHSVQNT